MKQFLYLLILASLSFSCSNKNAEEDFSVNWLMEYNDDFINRLNRAVEEKGNRKTDSIIAAKSNILVQNNREVLYTITEKNKLEHIQSIDKLFKNDPQIGGIDINQLFKENSIENLSLLEIKRRILMYELQVLTNLSQKNGSEDISFDKLDIYFIPDHCSNLNYSTVKGRLVLTAMSEKIGESADFYFDGEKLKEEMGYGVININRNELLNKDSIEIKVKFPEWELTKRIKI